MPERERIARLLKDIYAKWAWAGSNTRESVWNLMTDALLADRGQPAPQLIALKAMLERLGQVHEIEGLMVEPLNLVDALLADRAGTDRPWWLCEFCYARLYVQTLPASWGLALQGAVCPECRVRVEQDGGYHVVKGGAYAEVPDPRPWTSVPQLGRVVEVVRPAPFVIEGDSDHAECERSILSLSAEIEEGKADNLRLRRWVSDLQSGLYAAAGRPAARMHCVYCGHQYGSGETTPVTMADALRAHVEQCPEHPMSALRAQLAQCIADGQRMAGQLEAAETRAEALERDGAGCGCKTDAQTGTRNGYMCEWHREKYLATQREAHVLATEWEARRNHLVRLLEEARGQR